MDEEVLVTALVEDGARLAVDLQKQGRLPRLPVWAFDDGASAWMLLIPFRETDSRRDLYGDIQRLLRKYSESQIALDQIVLVRESDPGFVELAAAARRNYLSSVQRDLSIEVNGRTYSDARAYEGSPNFFEQQIERVVRDALPEGAVLHHGRSVDRAEFKSIDPPDLVLATGGITTLIEVKATQRPVGMSSALQALGLLAHARPQMPGRRVEMMLVSLSGFTPGVESEMRFHSSLLLIDWRKDGRAVLTRHIEALANSPVAAAESQQPQ